MNRETAQGMAAGAAIYAIARIWRNSHADEGPRRWTVVLYWIIGVSLPMSFTSPSTGGFLDLIITIGAVALWRSRTARRAEIQAAAAQAYGDIPPGGPQGY